jgi:hypothetical protein
MQVEEQLQTSESIFQSLPISVDQVSIVTLKLAKINAVTADLSANVSLLWAATETLPSALNLAVARATIAVLEVLVVALVCAKIEAVTTDLIAGSGCSASADEPSLNAALIRAATYNG